MFFPFFFFSSSSSSSFERFVFMWTRPSAAATRPEGSAAAVSESGRKGREGKRSLFLAFRRRFRREAERSSSPSSKPGEAVFCWKQVGSAESRPCVRPAGGAGGRGAGGGGRRRCPRPVFFPQASLPILCSPLLVRLFFFLFFSRPGALGLDFSPFGLSSGELAVRT